MKKVEIYTDGACSGNPGPGGWGAVLLWNGHEKEISGGEKDTTNNRMEVSAVIMALSALKEPCEVTLFSDSAYTVNAFNLGWIRNWETNGWKTADRKDVQNADLWKRLLDLTKIHRVTFVKVKGHADNAYNNRCDELARNAIKALEA